MPSLDNADASELRRRIVDAGIAAFRAEGHVSVGIDEVARYAGLRVDEVLAVFVGWDLLIIAILDGWVGVSRREGREAAETEGAAAYVRTLLRAAAADPAMVRTRLAFMGAATDENHVARGWYRAQYAQLVQDVALFFTRDIVAKREPRSISPRRAAEQLIALFEGLQVESTMLDSVDLLSAWDDAVGFLRLGWSA
jgi:hypothetical protein